MIEVRSIEPDKDNDHYVIDFFDADNYSGTALSLSPEQYDALVETIMEHGDVPPMDDIDMKWKDNDGFADIPEPDDSDLFLIEELNQTQDALDRALNNLYETERDKAQWRDQAERTLALAERLALA